MPRAHVSEVKKKEVAEFVALMEEYPVIGVVNMMGLPTPQVQSMRGQLRGSVVMKMTKKTLGHIIIEKAASKKPGLEKLADHLKGMPAFIFTKDNPFGLYKTLKKKKSTAPAKAGQVAPNDIVVPAGPTSFAPGPIIGELGSVGIKAGIDGGKVVIKQDSVVAKAGDVVSAKLAAILTRLGIQPMEIGLDLMAVYEKGSIFEKKVLDVDEDAFKANIAQAHAWAFNLAMEAGIYNADTTELLITNAHRDAYALAVSEAIEAKEVIDELLARADAQAASVSSLVNL